MVTRQQIDEAVKILVRSVEPQRIILFGSYANGNAREDSDVDLLVVKSKVINKPREMIELRRALSPLRIPVDVLVTDEEQIKGGLADFPGSYLYHALREGKTLYAVA